MGTFVRSGAGGKPTPVRVVKNAAGGVTYEPLGSVSAAGMAQTAQTRRSRLPGPPVQIGGGSCGCANPCPANPKPIPEGTPIAQCANLKCGKGFPQTHVAQKFCSPACRQKVYAAKQKAKTIPSDAGTTDLTPKE